MLHLLEKLGVSQHLADIERIRNILGEDKLLLAGHSFGGFLALLYAIEFPEQVEKLILVSPADMIVMPQEDGGFYKRLEKHLPEKMMKYLDFFLADNDGINRYENRNQWQLGRKGLMAIYDKLGIPNNKIFHLDDELIGVWEKN